MRRGNVGDDEKDDKAGRNNAANDGANASSMLASIGATTRGRMIMFVLLRFLVFEAAEFIADERHYANQMLIGYEMKTVVKRTSDFVKIIKFEVSFCCGH